MSETKSSSPTLTHRSNSQGARTASAVPPAAASNNPSTSSSESAAASLSPLESPSPSLSLIALAQTEGGSSGGDPGYNPLIFEISVAFAVVVAALLTFAVFWCCRASKLRQEQAVRDALDPVQYLDSPAALERVRIATDVGSQESTAGVHHLRGDSSATPIVRPRRISLPRRSRVSPAGDNYPAPPSASAGLGGVAPRNCSAIPMYPPLPANGAGSVSTPRFPTPTGAITE